MNITEFGAGETPTACMTSHSSTDGACYDGPISIGIYAESTDEIWIEFDGARRSLNVDDVKAFCKQLSRALKMAKENSK